MSVKNMSIIEVADKIEGKIKLLEKAREDLRGYAEDKALLTALYDKELAVCLIKLQAGKPFEIDGEAISKPPASTAEKIAKGLVWEAKQQMLLAEATYKIALSTLDSIAAELNGWQSINRYLEKV